MGDSNLVSSNDHGHAGPPDPSKIENDSLDGLPIAHTHQNPTKNLDLYQSSWDRKISSRLKDYVCNTTWTSITKSHSSSALPTSSASQGKSLYPFANYLTCDKFSDGYKHFLASVTTEIGPTRYSDVVSHPK